MMAGFRWTFVFTTELNSAISDNLTAGKSY